VPKLGSHESLASSSTGAGSSCMDSGTHPHCGADSTVQVPSPGEASSQAWCRGSLLCIAVSTSSTTSGLTSTIARAAERRESH
jgi:hypothetical protein